jgi:rSAM/selenodomain-associated transferase 2
VISVIVPVLDEEAEIPGALASLAGEGAAHEVVVVDGGSADRSVALARAGGARIVAAPRGRGAQMNGGARAATGEILVFLHADVRMPPGALAGIVEACADPAVAGGGFCKRYDRETPLLVAMAGVQNQVRSRLGHSLVGTQAMFVRRAVFDRLGGFREWPLLEDVDFSDRLRREGRIAILAGPVLASARRYHRRGVVRQIAINATVLALFRLGASPGWLRRLYLGLR